MKKIVCVLLSFILLLGVCIIPTNAEETAYEGDTYYKFTFGENGTAYKGDYINNTLLNHKGNKYYSLWDITDKNNTQVKQSSVYDKATGKTVDTMNIVAKESGVWRWVPLKADGTPFEVKPNASYTVNIKMYVRSIGAYGQFFVYASLPNENVPTSSEADWQKGLFTTMGTQNGQNNSRVNISGPFTSSSIRYAGTQSFVFDEFDSNNTSQYYSGSSYLKTRDNAKYDAENNTYTFTFDVWSSKQSGGSWVNDSKTGERTYNNYFYLGGGGNTFVVNGKTYYNDWEIAEIEVVYNDPDGVDRSIYQTGFNKVPYADSPANSYIADTGAVTEGTNVYKNNFSVVDVGASAEGGNGKVLKYDHLKDSYCSSHKTTKSATYAPYNAVAFGEYISTLQSSSYKVTIDYKADVLEAPLKLGVMLVATTNNIWTGSVPKEIDYYTVSEVTDGWKTATYYFTVPDTYDVNVYNNQYTDKKYVAFYVSPESDENITVYFDNLTVMEVPTVNIYDEYGNKTILKGEVGQKINFPVYDGSYEIYSTDGTGNVIMGQGYYFDEQLKNEVNQDVAVFTTKKQTNYYKGYKKLYSAIDQISFCGFENIENLTNDGFKDLINGYIIGKYDHSYEKLVNGIKKTEIETSTIADTKGFYSTSFSIVDGGYLSEKALAYEYKNDTLKYNVADISNGVLLEDKTTYKLDFFYKAEGQSTEPITFSFLNMMNGENMGQSSSVTITDVSNQWSRVEIYLTTDFALCEVKSGYSGEKFCIPAIKVLGKERTVYMDLFSISKVIKNGGVSVLKDDDAQTNGGQAMRFFFSYTADKNGNLITNGQTKQVKERGIIFSGSKEDDLVIENADKNGIIITSKTHTFDDCWNYENGVLTFSTYVNDFSFTDSRTVYSRGYIVLEDMTVVYSDITEKSLDDVLEINKLKESVNAYSLTDKSVSEKVVFQGATQQTTNGYSFDWTGSTLKIKAKAVGEMKVYLTAGTNDYFTVYINGKCISDLLKGVTNKDGNTEVSFDVGMDNDEKIIEFSRQKEAMSGTYDIIGFSFAGQLLTAEENDILIEFIGDSITSGMGVIGTKTDWRTDGTNAFAYLTAQTLGVDFRIRSKSGIGVRYAADSTQGPKSDWISSYSYENCFRDLVTPYTQTREADVIVINLGTNDCDHYDWYLDETEKNELYQSYLTLFEVIRRYSPNAKILCVSGGMTTAYGSSMEKAVKAVGGEENGYFFTYITSGLTQGGAGHPTEYQQRIIATELINILKKDFI